VEAAAGSTDGGALTLQQMIEQKRECVGKAVMSALGSGLSIPGAIAVGMSKAGKGGALFASGAAKKLVGLGAMAKAIGAGPAILATAAAVGAAVAIVKTAAGISDWNEDMRLEHVFDADDTRRTLEGIEARAADVFAAQRGSVWLVLRAGDRIPDVMDEERYAEFKKKIAADEGHLDEVRIDLENEKISVMRYAGGKLDAGDRDIPAVVQSNLDLQARLPGKDVPVGHSPAGGKPDEPELRLLGSEEHALTAAAVEAGMRVGWFAEGKKTTPEFVSARNGQRREPTPPAPMPETGRTAASGGLPPMPERREPMNPHDEFLAQLGRKSERETSLPMHILNGTLKNLATWGTAAVGIFVAASAFSAQTGIVLGGPGAGTAAGLTMIAACGAMMGYGNWKEKKVGENLFDSPEAQQILRRMEAVASEAIAAGHGAMAARRGAVWLVRSPGKDLPEVMNDREYAAFKKEAAGLGTHLDEVKIDGDKVSVSRFVGGKLDAGGRDLPSVEQYTLSAETVEAASKVAWFSGGKRSSQEEVEARNAWTREQEVSGPGAAYP